MTIKRVRLNQEVHEKLLDLKYKTNAKSINDVITQLIEIAEETYINNGTIKTANKQIIFKYDNGKLVELKIRNHKN